MSCTSSSNKFFGASKPTKSFIPFDTPSVSSVDVFDSGIPFNDPFGIISDCDLFDRDL